MPFGDGSDGDVVISVNTTLTCDMNYKNLTINTGVTLYPDGYIIYVKNVLTVNGFINRNGNNASYSTPGAGLPTRSVGGSGAGGVGGDGYNIGSNGVSVSGVACSVGGDGGDGGGTIPKAGGDGGITTSCHPVVCADLNDIVTNASSRLGGPGGGGGGSYRTSYKHYPGGGGGSGAGVIYISASEIVINTGGGIYAVGGFGSGGSGGGGGGGGGGACVALEYETITNDGVLDVSGGLGYSGPFVSIPGESGTSGITYLCEVAAATTTKSGRPLRHSTGASVPGGIGCGMGKSRR